ncbi:hypothetical protein ALC152_09280 [Arcobacter sp. 15-2]|uniref:flagellar hook assembly protein FlgD n=1 Tax=Arcobacter sp. 15-2 TaxID=3374109 RepID=UPI00399D3BD5
MAINATNAQETAATDKAYWDKVKADRAANAQVSTGTDEYGNAVTTAIANDSLTNNDFLKLMLEELKQQDPTKPQDSAALMDSQLKMSTIQSNQDMSAAMTTLQASYANSALSTAANLVGKTVQNGETDDSGDNKVYKVNTIENKNGELYMKVAQMTGIVDGLKNTDTDKISRYDANGVIYEDGVATEYTLALDSDGRFTYNEDGTLKILDKDNDVIKDAEITDRYVYATSAYTYADPVEIPLSSVTVVSN